jgi:hypothetical protein
MVKRIFVILLFGLFVFSVGCIQDFRPHQFLNSNEENISQSLVNVNSIDEMVNVLDTEKIPLKIGSRPTTGQVWILAEIDEVNETWIAIDVQQKILIHKSEDHTYFSGIFFDSYADYQNDLEKRNYTPGTFAPVRQTTSIPIVTTSLTTSTPLKTTNIPDFNFNSIFIEAIIGFILGTFSIYLLGCDYPGLFGYIIVLFVILGAGLAMVNQQSTDISTIAVNLSNFIVLWVIECGKMALGAAIGAVCGAILKSIQGFG